MSVHRTRSGKIGAGAPESKEPTSAMIEAGADVIWRGVCGALLPADFSAESIASQVYLEMQMLQDLR
jgi:hypothetical protein